MGRKASSFRATSATSRSAMASISRTLSRPTTNSIPTLGSLPARRVMNKDGTPTNDNPRKVPGILASPDDTPGHIKFGSDKSTPSIFWITNGWNDFQGNMAAGAGFCGVCYWEVPASISGHSRHEDWELLRVRADRGALRLLPAHEFRRQFLHLGDDGVSDRRLYADLPRRRHQSACSSGSKSIRAKIRRQRARRAGQARRVWTERVKQELADVSHDYYPNVENGQLKQATKCPDTGKCDELNIPAATLCQGERREELLAHDHQRLHHKLQLFGIQFRGGMAPNSLAPPQQQLYL